MLRLPTGHRLWKAQAEGHCIGCDLVARCPDRLRQGVEALIPITTLEMQGMPDNRLREALDGARRQATDGLAMADWFVSGTPRPRGAMPVLAPLARFVTAIHMLADR